MTRRSRRTPAQRAEAKQARAYVELMRRKALTNVQAAFAEQVADHVDQITAERTAPRKRRGRPRLRAHLTTGMLLVGVTAVALITSPFVIWFLIHLATH